MKKIIFILIFIQFNVLFFAADIKFKHLTTKDGLTQNIITDIYQDKEGYMWFGTRNGLNKFDGFSIKQYFHSDIDSTSLASNSEIFLWTDNEGELWVYTTNWLHKYRSETDDFVRYKYDGSKENEVFLSIKEFYEKKLIFEKFNAPTYILAPFYCNEDKNIFYKTSVKLKNNPDAELYYSFLDNEKKLWLFYIISENQSFIVKYHPDSRQEIFEYNNQVVPLIVEDDNVGNLLIGTWNHGIKKLNKSTGVISNIKYSFPNDEFKLSDGIVASIEVEKNGNFWFVLWGKGLAYYNNTTGKIDLYSHREGVEESLSHNVVSRLFKDRTGNLWVGSLAKGINFFNPKKTNSVHIRKSYSDKSTLSNNSIYSLLEDSFGKIWIGTDGGGLNVYNPKTNEFTSFDKNTKNSLNTNTIISLFEDDNKDILIGNWFNFMQKFDRKTGKLISFDGKELPECDEIVARDFFKDSAGNIWIAGENKGITLFDVTGNKFKTILINKKLVSNFIGISYSVAEDSEHNMLFGGSTGLLKYNPSTGKSELVFKEKGSYFVWSLLADNQNDNVWVGTNGNGLKRLNSKTLKFNTPDFLNELSQNIIYGILQDNQNRLWISTSNGIYRINLGNEKIVRFGISEGLQDRDFNQGAFAKLASGEIMFGGHNGFNIINPKTFVPTEEKPEILITEFLVDGEKVFPKNDFIQIPYEKNDIQIEFTNLDFINAPKTIFRYKLDNFDDDCFEVDFQRRYARYTNLPAGKYNFTINIDNDGLYGSSSKNIRIVILKPLWQEWWFILILLLVLIGFVYIVLKIKTRILLSRSKKLEKLIKEKTCQLKMKNEELEAIFNNAIAGIVISDFDFNITYGNKYLKNIVLEDGSDYSNKKIVEFIHPDDLQKFISNIKKLNDNEADDFYTQIRIKNRSSKFIWTGLSCSKISNKNKKYLIMVIVDINEQKLSQQKVLDLEKRNSAMAMAVTANHELNQPLMVISGNLDMMVLTSENSFIDKQGKRIEKISESIELMSKILRKYQTINDIEFEDYTDSTEMVKIEK